MSELLSPAEFFGNYTYNMVFWGTTVIGFVAGTLGSFAYLRRQSLISDVISHSALPGTLTAFIVIVTFGGDGRSMLSLLIGAIFAGTAAMYLTNLITQKTKIAVDTAMAVVLASFFGLGMLLLQHIAKTPYPGKGGIQDYLFGNASTITRGDLLTSMGFGGLALVLVIVFWRQLSITTFDRQHSLALGLNVKGVDLLIYITIVIATVIGLKAVGLVLMVAFVVTPPATARQLTHSLPSMVILSGVIGAVGSAVGAYLSIVFGSIPTGPIIVIVLFVMFVLSVLCAPGRSVWAQARRRQAALKGTA